MGDSKIVNRPLPNSRTGPILLFRLRITGNSFAIFFYIYTYNFLASIIHLPNLVNSSLLCRISQGIRVRQKRQNVGMDNNLIYLVLILTFILVEGWWPRRTILQEHHSSAKMDQNSRTENTTALFKTWVWGELGCSHEEHSPRNDCLKEKLRSRIKTRELQL